MATYPQDIRTFTPKVDIEDIIWAEHVNTVQEEINAIQATLGSMVHGSHPSARARFESLETRMGNTEAHADTLAPSPHDNGHHSVDFLDRAGDTMTGMLLLPGTNPTDGNHATRKAYVDTTRAPTPHDSSHHSVGYVERGGDTMTGMLVLPSTNPTQNNHATRKGWVDANKAPTPHGGAHHSVDYLDRTGDSMTGMLTLPSTDPSINNHAVRKAYVDNLVAQLAGSGHAHDDSYVNLAGDTMTGALLLPSANPTDANEAARKAYVDSQVAGLAGAQHSHDETYVHVSGGIMTGRLTLSADPIGALQAATKQYADQYSPANIDPGYVLGSRTGAKSNGSLSTAIGTDAYAQNIGIAIGQAAKSNQLMDTAIGRFAKSDAIGGIAFGYQSLTTLRRGISIGTRATVNTGGHYGTVTTADDGIAIGTDTVSRAQSIVIGRNSATNTTNTVIIGNDIRGHCFRHIFLGDENETVMVRGRLTVKGSKTFQIVNPNDDTEELRHSAYEGPIPGGNVYRTGISAVGGVGSDELPDYFDAINTDVQVFVQPVDHFGQAYGWVDVNTVHISANQDGDYHVVVFGTRADPGIDDWYIMGDRKPVGMTWDGEPEILEEEEAV